MKKRLLIVLTTIGVAILLLPPLVLAWAYGEPEPCRALAVERARLTASSSGAPASVLEPWQRLQTSQLSAAQCAGGLLDSWGERLSHRLPAR